MRVGRGLRYSLRPVDREVGFSFTVSSDFPEGIGSLGGSPNALQSDTPTISCRTAGSVASVKSVRGRSNCRAAKNEENHTRQWGENQMRSRFRLLLLPPWLFQAKLVQPAGQSYSPS